MDSGSIEMDQALAKRLFVEGGTLILLNTPSGTDFGIDIKSWKTAENFKGVKMIPPGFHYIHYSAVDEFGDMAPRIGFMHYFKKSEIVVKRWDTKEEGISSDSVPEDIVNKIKDNLKDLDRYLGAYPYDIWKKWTELTSRIDASLVERCSPLCGFVRSALEMEHCDDSARLRSGQTNDTRRRVGLSSQEKEELLLPDLKPKPGTELRLTNLPNHNYPKGATPMEITRHSLDTSYALETMLAKLKDPLEIIGEFQMVFVCFLAGQSLDAFEYWKKLVSLICGADSAIPQRRSIYMDFLKVLQVQLEFVPEEILCDIVESNNFVYHNLRKLFANVESNSEIDGRLKSYAVRVRDSLTKKFLWDFFDLQEEGDDEAPVVVSLD